MCRLIVAWWGCRVHSAQELPSYPIFCWILRLFCDFVRWFPDDRQLTLTSQPIPIKTHTVIDGPFWFVGLFIWASICLRILVACTLILKGWWYNNYHLLMSDVFFPLLHTPDCTEIHFSIYVVMLGKVIGIHSFNLLFFWCFFFFLIFISNTDPMPWLTASLELMLLLHINSVSKLCSFLIIFH